MTDELDIVEKAKLLLGETDGEGYGWGGFYDIIDIIKSLISEVETSRNLVAECKEAGTYDAAMHKRDKRQLNNWKKALQQLQKTYSNSKKVYDLLNNKYVEMCSAYSGIPLRYSSPPNNQGDLAVMVPITCGVSSGAGTSTVIEEAEKKLKKWKEKWYIP